MKATHKKIIGGPAGINCSCCRVGSKKTSRVLLNRLSRRQQKMVDSFSARTYVALAD